MRVFSRNAFDDRINCRDADGQPEFFFKYRDQSVKRCVWDFKYYLNGSALGLMADIMSDEIIAKLSSTVSSLPFRKPARIIYAPSSSFASGKRNWDQMHELSVEIASRANPLFPLMAVANSAISFTDGNADQKSQHESSRNERIMSVRSKFKISESGLRSLGCCTFFCIDDVMTTGATLSAISELVMTETGARVSCLAFCH